MKTKLAVVNLGAHGHVNPTLPVVAELVRRGVDVVYLTTNEFAGAVKATGSRFVGHSSLFTAKTTNVSKEMAENPKEMMARFPLKLLEEAEHVLPQIMPVLVNERPTAIWYDNMAVAGRLASQILHIPAMMTRPTYVANEHFSLARSMPHVAADHPARGEFQNLAKRLQDGNGMASALQIPDLFMTAEALNVVFMPRAFQPSGETFDDRFKFVGPSIASRPNSHPFQPPGDGKPLLLISLGTVFNDWPEFFSTCFEAFGSSPFHVVMAVGNRIDVKSLGKIPDNFHVEAYVPQLEVLPHASAFITHGGMNSTQEALYFGVPLVVIPQMNEQAATAGRVQQLGLGRSFMTRPEVTVAALREAATAIATEPSYKREVEKMQKEVRAAGGYQLAASLIQDHLATLV